MTVLSDRRTALAGELRNVNKWYGDHHVLSDVSVAVGRGEIVALIGAAVRANRPCCGCSPVCRTTTPASGS
jgi:ABC-type polar amino acid transport system ATPase subunit